MSHQDSAGKTLTAVLTLDIGLVEHHPHAADHRLSQAPSIRHREPGNTRQGDFREVWQSSEVDPGATLNGQAIVLGRGGDGTALDPQAQATTTLGEANLVPLANGQDPVASQHGHVVSAGRYAELDHAALQRETDEANRLVQLVVECPEEDEQASLGQWTQLEFNRVELQPLVTGSAASGSHRLVHYRWQLVMLVMLTDSLVICTALEFGATAV